VAAILSFCSQSIGAADVSGGGVGSDVVWTAINSVSEAAGETSITPESWDSGCLVSSDITRKGLRRALHLMQVSASCVLGAPHMGQRTVSAAVSNPLPQLLQKLLPSRLVVPHSGQ
jgi:hypothetical protein